MDSDQDDQYTVIIVECCENCDTHQSITRHSEWKYFEQFNQFKRKIERFVANTIVIKNPIPDELHKPPEGNLNKNQYMNKETNQIVLFPRIAAFEVYIFNVLVYSKLLSNSWPNHYKLIQTLNKVIEEKKKGNSLDEFSLYHNDGAVKQQPQESVEQKSKPATTSKKKKDYRVYKSKDKPIISHHPNQSPVKKANLDPINSTGKKGTRRTLLDRDRGLETKAENRIKLPALKNTINFKEDENENEEGQNEKDSLQKSGDFSPREADSKGLKKIFNSIEEFEKEEISFISKKQSMAEENQFNSLEMDEGNESMDLIKSLRNQDSMKFLQNRSVQYSERQFGKDYMNRSIQYEEDEGRYIDFGLQFDDGTNPRETNVHYVQTEKVGIVEEEQQQQRKPYMLDEEVQANIIIPKDEKEQQIQTTIKQFQQKQLNTDIKSFVNRGYQFPEEQAPKVEKTEFNVIDDSFKHLFEKRRNVHDESCFYSVDKFEEKNTKYKWIGRAGMINENVEKGAKGGQVFKDNIDEIRRSFTLEMLVFCFYNFYGVKTPDKRLSLQTCSNVIVNPDDPTNRINSMKTDTALIHILTADNPELQYPQYFEQCEYSSQKYPLAEELTFKNSKQKVKFNNYGGLLALAYFLGDRQVFSSNRSHIGLVISNDEVKQIHKLTADKFNIDLNYQPIKNRIIVDYEMQGNEQKIGALALDRMSEQIQHEFIATISKIISEQQFIQLLRSLEDNFVHMLPSHKNFKASLNSTKLEKIDQMIVEDFLEMLKVRRENLAKMYKGEIYAYHTYHSLQPKICYSLENTMKKNESSVAQNQNPSHIELERTFKYNNKLIKGQQIEKHIRNKDNFVIIEGESGIGKTSFLTSMITKMKNDYGDKLKFRLINKEVLNDQLMLFKRVNEILDEYRKQIIIIDDAEANFSQSLQFLRRIYDKEDPRSRPEMSFCLSINTNGRYSEGIRYRSRVVQYGLEVITCQMMPLDVDEIRKYFMKCVQFHNYTEKKNLSLQLLGQQNIPFNESHPKFRTIKVLQNPFYLNLYVQILGHVQDLSDSKTCLLFSFNRYTMLKEAYQLTYKRHYKQSQEMVQQISEECSYYIKKMAFEYFHNHCEVNENVREFVSKIATDNEIIKNQMSFYPVNLEALVKKEKDLFMHQQYLNFFLVESYCYYIEKSYRNLKMPKLYAQEDLLNLIGEHYAVEHTHSKLIEIVEKSRKYKNTQEQASCALTLLTKIGFTFSNYNFDEVEIPDADVSYGVFYNTSFRSANLEKAQFYRTQMTNCQIDGARMDSINLLVKKYEIQYTVLTAAMSNDGRNIALGCGNYLIILQAESGKELKKIQAHMDVIRTVKYSKDNNTLVTIADDKTLRMWDTKTYRSVVFRLPQKGTIAFSNETETIASVSKNNLKVWNIKSMANEFILQGHGDLITCLQFSVDGKFIVTGSRDATIKLWSLSKGEVIRTMKGHSGQLISVRISSTKRLIVSSSKEKDIIVWGFEKGNEIGQTKLPDEVTDICLDEKEKYMAIALAKQHKISVLNVETLGVIHVLEGHQGRILSLRFDLNFKKLVSLGRDKTVRVWDFDKIMEYESKSFEDREKSRLKSSRTPILCLAFCKISLKYVAGHSNGQINFYSSIDNRLIDQVYSHNGAVQCLSFDKSGKLYSAGSDGHVRVWNLSQRREPRIYELHSSEVYQMKLSEKNRLIVTSSVTNELVVTDFTGINIIMSTREEGRVHSIDFSRDEKIMAVGGTEKYIAIYEISEGGNGINRVEELGPNADVITCIKFHGENYLVTALKNGQVAIWNHHRGTMVKKIENISPINSVITFQKKYVGFSSEDGKIRIVDMNQGKQAKIFKYHESATSITTNTGQNLLYISTKSGNIVAWNLNSIKPKNDKIQFDRLTFDEEGNRVVHVDGPKNLLIRDLHFHEEEYIAVKDVPSVIEGVSFYKGQIILLLKNGMHWDLAKNREYMFGDEQEIEGDLHWVKDKEETNFFRTAVKKIKGIKKPILSILEEIAN